MTVAEQVCLSLTQLEPPPPPKKKKKKKKDFHASLFIQACASQSLSNPFRTHQSDHTWWVPRLMAQSDYCITMRMLTCILRKTIEGY